MKIQRTISVDLETWTKAKHSYENISERINQLLEADIEQQQNQEPEKLEEYKKALAEKTAELSVLKEKIATKEKNDEVLFSIE